MKMKIQQQIKSEMTEAMKNREEIRLMVLRGLLSGFTNELVASGKKPQDEIDDSSALNVIKRAVKQRRDSIEQYGKGGREDLVANETAELEILKKYLPEMMSEEKIQEIAVTKKAELGIEDKSKMGIFIGSVMGQIKSTGDEADGALVKKVVEELFN